MISHDSELFLFLLKPEKIVDLVLDILDLILI